MFGLRTFRTCRRRNLDPRCSWITLYKWAAHIPLDRYTRARKYIHTQTPAMEWKFTESNNIVKETGPVGANLLNTSLPTVYPFAPPPIVNYKLGAGQWVPSRPMWDCHSCFMSHRLALHPTLSISAGQWVKPTIATAEFWPTTLT